MAYGFSRRPNELLYFQFVIISFIFIFSVCVSVCASIKKKQLDANMPAALPE